MKCVRPVAIVFAMSVLAVGTSIAQGTDQETAANVAHQTTAEAPPPSPADPVSSHEAEVPPRDDAEPQKRDEVLKTKTRSNQSNDRVVPPPQAADDEQPAEPDAILKTKTKSNQSND